MGEEGVASVLCREAVGQEQSSVTVNGGINREDCELQLQECSNTPIITVVFSWTRWLNKHPAPSVQLRRSLHDSTGMSNGMTPLGLIQIRHYLRLPSSFSIILRKDDRRWSAMCFIYNYPLLVECSGHSLTVQRPAWPAASQHTHISEGVGEVQSGAYDESQSWGRFTFKVVSAYAPLPDAFFGRDWRERLICESSIPCDVFRYVPPNKEATPFCSHVEPRDGVPPDGALELEV